MHILERGTIQTNILISHFKNQEKEDQTKSDQEWRMKITKTAEVDRIENK